MNEVIVVWKILKICIYAKNRNGKEGKKVIKIIRIVILKYFCMIISHLLS